ncbi:MAG: neutral zinc metallopeptidase [Nitratireductor sp.]|nr:neutral zinc metallopeptidase [Nitratireductor sp.]MCC0022180.1 neutral zinc metallopeptidase [Nitratireductor sp.]
MRWQGRRRSTNVNDMRGRSGGGGMFRIPSGGGGGFRIPSGGQVRPARSGGFGCGTLIVIGVVLWLLGLNPLTILGQLAGGGLNGGLGPSISPQNTPEVNRQTGTNGNQDEMKQFVEVVVASNEDIWTKIFSQYGKQLPLPELNIFSGQVRSACGLASSASGPFYCPGDSHIYIDLAFYNTLSRQFGATGDFAYAYVVSHEYGHHIQNVIGVLPQFNRMRQTMGKLDVNRTSVKVELQADCFAGVWGHYVAQEGWLEEGDLMEALNAAEKIGDDAIQRKTQGYVVPDSFNHGTSDQRRFWFKRGFDSGRLESCDTFNADI